MNSNFVLDANSAHAFHINSRFQSHYVTRTNFLFLTSANPRPLVDFDAEAVTGAVHEIRAEAMLIEKTPRGPVNASGSYTGAKSVLRRFLGLLYRFVPSSNASGCAPQKDRARQITAVVAEYSTQVQDHQFVFLQSFFSRPRMRQSGTRPGGDDGLERGAARSFVAQTIVDLGSDFQFRYTWPDEIGGLGNDLGSEPGRTAHHIEFLRAFYFTDAFDEFGGRFPFDTRPCPFF